MVTKSARPSKPEALLHCSFCGKDQHQVRALVAGPKVFICDDCAAMTVACLPVRGKLAALSRRKKALAPGEREEVRAHVAAFERRVAEIATTDFFGASGREVVSGLLRELATKGEDPAARDAPAPSCVAPGFRE